MDRRTLNAIVEYIARSAAAACLLLWGVVNMATLLTQFFQREGDEQNWFASFLLCLGFGLLPFCIGAWLLFRLVAANSVAVREPESLEPKEK